MLHRQSDGFDERNLFLQVTLGLLSLGDRLDALLARPACAPGSAPAGEPAHPIELMILGAVATSRHLRQRLAAIVPDAVEEPPPAATTADAAPPRPDALRRWLT